MASLKRWLDRRRNPWKADFYDAFGAWRKDKGQARLSDYADLPAGAVAFDFGGYKGIWTDDVLRNQPDCTVHVFEPHPTFAAELVQKFAGHKNVHVHGFALGQDNGTLTLSDSDDGSSAVADLGQAFDIEVKSVAEFFVEHEIAQIDLVKMNIEGGEYDLLPALVDAGIMARIVKLQVQFHLFEPALKAARDAIIAQLKDTHECDWVYPFVWEQWARKA